jgi:hypothetical protein
VYGSNVKIIIITEIYKMYMGKKSVYRGKVKITAIDTLCKLNGTAYFVIFTKTIHQELLLQLVKFGVKQI